jgi:DNA-binding GntR family transcriptional regulator
MAADDSQPAQAVEESLLEAPSLRSQVYDRLREAILAGDLAPGDRISPVQVAKRFRVSPMPVRDALRLLEQDGLVETAARRWTRVVVISPELVSELVPLASLLERHAITSAKTIPADGLRRLRDANATFSAALERGDLAAARQADRDFHDTLVGLANNRSLERALRDVRTRAQLLRPRFVGPSHAAESVADHEAIIEHLERGDRRAAARALDQNWRRSLERLRSAG